MVQVLADVCLFSVDPKHHPNIINCMQESGCKHISFKIDTELVKTITMKKIWRENELEEFRLLLPVSITNEVVLTSFYCNPTLHRGHLALIKGAMKYICIKYCGFNTFVVAINGEKSTK